MMATVERIEEEDNGVITVYFSSPYEVPTAVHTVLTSDTQGKITTYTTG
jgi:hypothetical protein